MWMHDAQWEAEGALEFMRSGFIVWDHIPVKFKHLLNSLISLLDGMVKTHTLSSLPTYLFIAE